MQTTNAAYRLFKILDAGKSLGRGGESSQKVLSDIFKTDESNLAALYSKFSQFILLIEDVNIRIQSLEVADKDILLRCIPTFRKAFGKDFAMQTQWYQYMGRIGDSDIGLLHFAAKAMDSISSEIELAPSELDKIKNECDQLFSKVKSSEIDIELRIILLDLIEAIRRSIADYQIRGAEGLKRVLSECLGRLALDKDIVVKNNDKDEMKAFWVLMGGLSTLFTLANQAPQLGERIGNLITLIQK